VYTLFEGKVGLDLPFTLPQPARLGLWKFLGPWMIS
jgi:hypothetical protein